MGLSHNMVTVAMVVFRFWRWAPNVQQDDIERWGSLDKHLDGVEMCGVLEVLPLAI